MNVIFDVIFDVIFEVLSTNRNRSRWRHVGDEKSVVGGQESVQALLAFSDAFRVGVEADELEGEALLEVDANAGTESAYNRLGKVRLGWSLMSNLLQLR